MSGRIKSLGALLGSVLATLFGLAIVTFMIGRVMPVDPVIAAVGDNAPEAVIQRTRIEMGLDQPIVVQFLRYLGDVVRGDFGNSILTRNPVTTDIAHYFPATMELATYALLLAVVIGVPLGIWAAVRQGSLTDQVIRIVCLAGHSVPVFVLALLALLVFYAWLGVAAGPVGTGSWVAGTEVAAGVDDSPGVAAGSGSTSATHRAPGIAGQRVRSSSSRARTVR